MHDVIAAMTTSPCVSSIVEVCAGRVLDLSRPAIMGVLNVTPNSFSDGGRHGDPDQALVHALAMAEAGASIIDIGGESTRPGAEPVSEREELGRVLPVLEKLSDLCVSVDTRRPGAMKAVAAAGASMINDIQALTEPYALEAVAPTGCAVCLMHMKGTPATMQREPRYDDVVAEVKGFLRDAVRKARFAGIGADRRHDERLAAQQVQVVGDVAGAAAELAPQFRDQEGHVQDVHLLRQDVILEAALEHHDVVVGDGAADQCAHGRQTR